MYSRTSIRNSLVAAVLGCALVAGFASPGSADSKDDLERKRSGVSDELGGAQESYDQSSKKYQAAAAELDKAQGQLNAAEAHLGETRGQLAVATAKDQQMQAELDKTEAELAEAKAKLEAGEKSLDKSEVEVKQFTLESLQEGDRGLRAFGDLLRGTDPTDFSQRMSINASVGDAQLATMERLDAARVMLSLNRDKVRELRDQVALKRKEAAANLEQKQILEAAAEEQAAEVGELVEARASARSTADAIMQDDQAKVRQLESERNRLSSQLRAIAAQEAADAAREARKRGGSSGGGGGGGGGGGSSAGNGSSLSYPSGSRITSRYGMRRHPITGVYKLHDGTDFGAGCGTPIRAAASGTVLQRYYNGGYGNRLIVNHGRMRGVSVVTTYNHATRYTVGAGQRVSRGQTIGYVGSTGYSTGCHLHFMVLTNGNTTNPMNWL